MSEQKKPISTSEMTTVGTKVRIVTDDGISHTFSGYMDAVNFLNSRKISTKLKGEIPEFYKRMINEIKE